MFLTNSEMSLIRGAVEAQSGLDPELVERCSNLIHIQAFDEAVRNAFVLLEERMRQILKRENATGFQMAQYAFSPNGPFTKLLAHSPEFLDNVFEIVAAINKEFDESLKRQA